MELPLHFRYQPPSSDSPYKTVAVPQPIVFILTSQLPKELQHQNSLRLPCNAKSNSNQLCLWTRVQLSHDEIVDGDLTAEIPQGLEAHKLVVVGITVFTTLLATSFIAYSFVKLKYRTEIDKKNK